MVAMNAPPTLSPETADAIRRAMALAGRGDLDGAAAEGEHAIDNGGDAITLSAMVGMFRYRNGDAAGAVPFLSIAYSGRPDDLMIASNLVNALFESGDTNGAYEVCPASLAERDPALLKLHAHLAQIAEDYPAAVSAYRSIVSKQPGDWEAWNNLGNALAGMDSHDASIDALRKSLDINPESAPTRLNLALQLTAVGQIDEGEGLLREALTRDPADLPAMRELGALLRLKGPSDEVVDLLQRASELDPQDAALALAHASEARDMDRFKEAELAYRRAIEIDPRHELANLGLANFLDGMNRADELPALARTAQAAGIESSTLAYIEALECRRSGKPEEGLLKLSNASELAERPRCENLRGHFLDQLGRYDEAFDAFSSMNALFRDDPSLPVERAVTYRDMVRTESSTLTSEWFATWTAASPEDGTRPPPAFLVGFPRSGTTLLDTILLSHPLVEILEEEPAVREANELLPDFEKLASVGDDELASARARYWDVAGKITDLRPGNVLIDKNPLHMNKLPLIHRLFPTAPVILAVRHPCDVVLSCFITNFSLNAGMANFLSLETTAELYNLSFSFAERAIEIMKLNTHIVKYESIVSNRELELRDLFGFLGLEWDDAVLDHQTTAKGREHIKTASYAQVVQPIYTRAAGRWEHYRKHLEPVLPILEPWIKRFGYSV